jgi:putative hydrolase of the HAD superfamily
MIKAVFFDMDNTLYDFDRCMRHGLGIAVQNLHERLPDTRGRITVEHLVRLREEIARDPEARRLNLVEARIESFRRALEQCGHDRALAPEMAKPYFANRFQRLAPFENVPETLRQLRARRCAVGIISNGFSLLKELGIDDLIDLRIFSEEVGVSKPDARIFEMAMARIPCACEEFMYVGDSVEHDVMGAMNAGAWTIWFNPYAAAYPDGLARPDFEIHDISEVVSVVDGLK